MSDNRRENAVIDDNEEIVRYPLAHRIQHFFLMAILLVLLLTGLPLLFPESGFFKALFIVPEMFTLRGQIHRIAALALVGLSAFHILYLIFSDCAHEDVKLMIPRMKDIKTGIDSMLFSLGVSKERPRVRRFNLMQKLHYCVLCVGVLAMIATGFLLWFQEEAMMLFPKWAFDLAATFHGYEALLVFLVLMVWHIYTVHLTKENFPMSKVWLTGKIKAGKMKKLYPEDYDELLESRRAKN